MCVKIINSILIIYISFSMALQGKKALKDNLQ